MTCPVDGKPLPEDQVICGACEETLARALGDIDALMEDLDTALTRQSRKRPARGNHERDDKPLPYDLGASRAASDLRGILLSWARLVSEERPSMRPLTRRGKPLVWLDGERRWEHLDHTPLPRVDTVQAVSSWLLAYTRWLAAHEAAPDAYSEIVGAVNNIRRTIDIAPDVQFIGPCYAVVNGVECTEILYAVEGHSTVRCRTCGTTWDPRDRILQALRHAENIAQDATTLSRSFSLKGIALETQRIKNWANRGHLQSVGRSHRKHPTYIVAHVARLVQLYEAGQKLTPWPTEQDTPA